VATGRRALVTLAMHANKFSFDRCSASRRRRALGSGERVGTGLVANPARGTSARALSAARFEPRWCHRTGGDSAVGEACVQARLTHGDHDHNGTLEPDEYKSVLGELRDFTKRTGKTAAQKFQFSSRPAVFHRLDSDKDGFLSRAELRPIRAHKSASGALCEPSPLLRRSRRHHRAGHRRFASSLPGTICPNRLTRRG
jgi:hypothetical protein